MSNFFKILLLTLLSTSCTFANCPPVEELFPCRCNEGTAVISCRDIAGRFDIKAVFDRATPFIEESTIFNELEIRSTSLFEIPENAIPSLKFRTITIDGNRGLDYISPNAFNATYAITEELSLWNNVLVNDAPNERDIFDFFNKFTQVTKIWLPGNRITSIPSNAFTQNLNLKQLYFGSNSIKTIGGAAFAQLPNLENLWMSSNSLTLYGILPDAFRGVSSKLNIDLTYNTEIIYLDVVIFKPLLDNAAKVAVGGRSCGGNGCTYRYLWCDSRADWICPNAAEYVNKLSGFLCIGGQPSTVWEYCQLLGN